MEASTSQPWLFSRRLDLAVFLGSAVGALLLLPLGAKSGALYGDTPDWAWIPAVLLVDVAHVYSTGFRVYFDKEELERRKLLYWLTPALSLLIGIAVYSRGELTFWRVLAYLAVFHFMRQQYGWVALYRARRGEHGMAGRVIDTATIYLATLYPLVYWHAHLPRRFWWFLPNDFTAIPSGIDRVVVPLYWAALAAYAGKSVYLWFSKKQINPGKDIVVGTTALCWYVGIVGLNSDYAFTVTNVITHGVPYMALIYYYARERRKKLGSVYGLLAGNPLFFLATLWLFAYLEEMVWDRGVWHDRSWFFGSGWEAGSLKILLVPLLAVPQITHYILDGFIWKRKKNPVLKDVFSPTATTQLSGSVAGD